MIGALAAAGRADLGRLGAAVLAAQDPEGEAAEPGEDVELVVGGGAADVVSAALQQLQAEQGAPAMAAAWAATGLDILAFLPSVCRIGL